MADAGRVGYRTNGLSSALQLHHPSSHVGQTDGIALPGVHQRRKPMDHAIADSHAPVTISHRVIRSQQTPQSVQYRDSTHTWADGALPRAPCPILARGGVRGARARKVPSVTLGTPLTQKPGSGLTTRSERSSVRDDAVVVRHVTTAC